jgi:urocanate hydratase
MYIGPQGIVHGTTITVLNGFRKIKKSPKGKLFVTSGLGGMSGAQPKQEILQVALLFVPKSIQKLHTFVIHKVG